MVVLQQTKSNLERKKPQGGRSTTTQERDYRLEGHEGGGGEVVAYTHVTKKGKRSRGKKRK